MRFESVRRICFVRPYGAILLQLLLFVLSSPFTVLSFRGFLYDFGAELKSNAFEGTQQQWTEYLSRYVHNESLVVFAFALLGIWYSTAHRIRIGIVILFLCLSYLVISSATRGFDRYLTPLLPFLFILASLGILHVFNAIQNRSKRGNYIFLAAVAFFISMEIGPSFVEAIKPAPNRDEMYRSYKWLSVSGATRFYYAGYCPDVELRSGGNELIKITRELDRPATKVFLDTLSRGNLLVIDHEFIKTNPHFPDSTFRLVFYTDYGYGQYIYTKTTPPSL